MQKAFVALVLALLATAPACGGGGGGGGPPLPFTGGWHLLRTDSGKFCGDTVVLGVPVTFAQAGSNVTMTTPDAVLTGSATGTSAVVGGDLIVVDTVTSRFVLFSDFALERLGDTITGTATVRESLNASGFPPLCEGVAALKFVPEMRLTTFNVSGATDVALDQPLVFTFTQDVDLGTVTPDTLSVAGTPGAFFEFTTADGRRMALVPRVPNFGDYTDAGLSPATTYVVDFADHLDPTSIRSTAGAPLLPTPTRTFTTTSSRTFVEPRRALVHLPGPLAPTPGLGDEDGCLNNPTSSLYTAPGFQSGSGPAATLLCLVNEGPPRVIPERCEPVHDERGVGDASTGSPGLVDLPPVQIVFNEPLRPDLVELYNASTFLGINVQLWRVGDVAGNPIALSAANQVPTNRPLVVQTSAATRIVLVSRAPVPPGTYLVNLRGLADLTAQGLVVTDRPSPTVGGYAAIDAGLAGVVPAGYRYYFRTD